MPGRGDSDINNSRREHHRFFQIRVIKRLREELIDTKRQLEETKRQLTEKENVLTKTKQSLERKQAVFDAVFSSVNSAIPSKSFGRK